VGLGVVENPQVTRDVLGSSPGKCFEVEYDY
jgi:hypothetical protein